MALGRMTKSMSGMGGVKQQMPVAPPAPAPKKRSVFSRARAPAVVPQGSPQQQAMQQQRAAALATNRLDRPLGAAPQQPATMQQFNQAPAATRVPAQQAQQSPNFALLPTAPTNTTSAPFTPQKVTDPAIRQALLNAPKPPAMRKGGAVKKKPGYAKGGMVMANCGASMKPQQKAKK